MALQRVWIPSPNFSSRGGAGVRLVIIHTAEGARTYRELGNFFANPSSQVSSHTGIDDTAGVIGEYVARPDKAWTAANANPVAIQTELCAFAAWTPADWAAHPVMLENCAAWIAEECAAFGIPIRRLSPSEAQGSGRGVCGHVDLGAWGGGHWDPGPGFPMDQVIAMAAGGVTPAPPTPQPQGGDEVPVTPVMQFGKQLSFGQVSVGNLWHFWSQDNGASWRGEGVMGASTGQAKTGDPLVSVSGEVNSDQLFFVTETDKAQVWIARQQSGGKWDCRRPGA